MSEEARERLRTLGVPDDVIDATPASQWYLLVQDQLYFGGPPTMTAADLAAFCGVDEDVVSRVWRSLGFPDPGARVLFRESDVGLFRMYTEGVAVFGEDPIAHYTRALGAAARMISDATTSLFLDVFGQERRESTPLQHVELAELGGGMMARMPDEIIRSVVLHHVRESQLFSDAAGAADSHALTVAVGFCDLVGSTVLLNNVDPGTMGRALLDFEAAASEIVVNHRGRIVKFVGDEVMFATVEPDDAEEIAANLVRWVASHEVLVSARAGIAYGEVVGRGGDLYGPTVNLAARLAATAAPASITVADPEGPTRVPVRGFDDLVAVRVRDVV